MELSVELENDNILLEIGAFEDLKFLVEKLDEAWDKRQFSLTQAEKGSDAYLLHIEEEDVKQSVELQVIVEDGVAYAENPLVHDLIMSEYQRYVDEFGPIPTE